LGTWLSAGQRATYRPCSAAPLTSTHHPQVMLRIHRKLHQTPLLAHRGPCADRAIHPYMCPGTLYSTCACSGSPLSSVSRSSNTSRMSLQALFCALAVRAAASPSAALDCSDGATGLLLLCAPCGV
jgi:hypothetical protein